MNKTIYDNYVYMTICEVTLHMYKQSNFSTHLGFCRVFKSSLVDYKRDVSKLNYGEYIKIYEIIKVLEIVFSMDTETMGGYIMDYFNEEKYLIFEKPVLAMKVFFPNSSIVGNEKLVIIDY